MLFFVVFVLFQTNRWLGSAPLVLSVDGRAVLEEAMPYPALTALAAGAAAGEGGVGSLEGGVRLPMFAAAEVFAADMYK